MDTLGIILKCMDRGISSIKNKTQVKDKIGGYYRDFVSWSSVYKALESNLNVKLEKGEKL